MRALALLAGCGASAALFLQEIRGDWLLEFVRANTLSFANRQRLIAAMASGGLVALVTGALVRRRRGPAALRRIAHLLSPSLLLGLLPPLLLPSAWDPLHASVAIGVFVLLLGRLARLSFDAWMSGGDDRIRTNLIPIPSALVRGLPVSVVIAAVVAYAVYMSIFTLWMHGRFQTFGYDLGQYDNIFWSTLQGHPLRCAPLGLTERWSELRNHADLAVFAFLPLYALRPRADTLLVIQAVVLALGAIPIYRFAVRRLPAGYACVLSLVYLLYPPMHGLQFYDFHFQPIAATFVLFVIDFVDDRRYMLAVISFTIAVTCREDISVGLAVLGAFLALSGHRRRAGIAMFIAASSYFVVIRFLVMPRFGSWGFHEIYRDLLPQGARGFGGVIATLLTNPAYVLTTLLTADKLRYTLQILAPVAFLPVKRPALAVSIVPGSIFTLLTTGYAPTLDIGFQYSAHFFPYLFPAAALALAGRAQDTSAAHRRAGIVAVLAGTILCGIFWGAIPPREKVRGGFHDLPMTPPTEADQLMHRDLQELHALIPADAYVAVSEPQLPHITRLNILSLRDTTDAEYLLYATGTGFYGSDNAERALAAGQFKIVAQRPRLVLSKRVQQPPDKVSPGP